MEEANMEKEMNSVLDLDGNQLLPISKVVHVLSNALCCAKCAIANHKTTMEELIDYCTEYEEMIGLEEESTYFFSKVNWLEWRLEKLK